MTAPAVVEVFTTFSKRTKSGFPLRWRWRVLDADGEVVGKSRHSFRTEEKCRADLDRDAWLPEGIEHRTTKTPKHRRAA